VPDRPDEVAVGLGEIHVANSGVLVAYSLGSCVAVCLSDVANGVAGMAHIVLPCAADSAGERTPGRYADTAIPALVTAIRLAGGCSPRLQCRIAGGASVLKIGGEGQMPQIGKRNVEAVRDALDRAGLWILAESTGGTRGRTVRMDVASGRIRVRTVAGDEEEL
jgi:chemotaxis protein CheD